MWIFQQHIKKILGIFLFISIAIPCSITYVKQFNPAFLPLPEPLQRFFANDETFANMYIPSYTNASGYALGMIFAYLIYTGKIHQQVIHNKILVGISIIIQVSFLR